MPWALHSTTLIFRRRQATEPEPFRFWNRSTLTVLNVQRLAPLSSPGPHSYKLLFNGKTPIQQCCGYKQGKNVHKLQQKALKCVMDLKKEIKADKQFDGCCRKAQNIAHCICCSCLVERRGESIHQRLAINPVWYNKKRKGVAGTKCHIMAWIMIVRDIVTTRRDSYKQ